MLQQNCTSYCKKNCATWHKVHFMTVRLAERQECNIKASERTWIPYLKTILFLFLRISNLRKGLLTFRRTQFWTHSRGRTRQTSRPTVTQHHYHLTVMAIIIQLHSTRHEYTSHWYFYSRKQVKRVFCGHVTGSDRAQGHIQFKSN